MKLRSWILTIVLAAAVAAAAQDSAKPGTTVGQGSSIPGLSGIPGAEVPGFLEFGGSRSDLTSPQPSWTDFYLRGMLALNSRNAVDGEATREERYGETGWFYTLGLTHSFGENVYADVHGGTSTGGFFLPKYRADGFLNFKVLPHKQLVLTAGGGYDKSKTVNTATRAQFGGTYYFERPWIVQGGVMLTHANPGNTLAPTGYMAVTQGRAKEHYITLRAELGREAYELVGDKARNRFTLFDFPIHNYSGNWRQWVGNNWGVNFTFERQVNPFFNRNGATLGLFLDF